MSSRCHRRSRAGLRSDFNNYLAPEAPEVRPTNESSLPAGSLADQFAEMFANDPEAIAWRDNERRAELFGNGR